MTLFIKLFNQFFNFVVLATYNIMPQKFLVDPIFVVSLNTFLALFNAFAIAGNVLLMRAIGKYSFLRGSFSLWVWYLCLNDTLACVFMQLCRSACDLFIVGIPTDYSLRLNDKVPGFSTQERAFRIGSLVCVQYISLFDEETCNFVIDSIDPDYIFYGRTMNDLETYEHILQKKKLTLIEYPWREERVEGKFFST